MSVILLAAPLLATAPLAAPALPVSQEAVSQPAPVVDAVPVEAAPAESAPAQPGPLEPSPAEPALRAAAPSEGTGGNEILVTGRVPSPADPVEKVNVASYAAVQAVDDAVIAPVTHAYHAGVPKPLRAGLRNVLNNLDEPIVFLNFLLQLKPGKAIETLGRFAVNSTVGVGGLVDVARKKPFNLPRRSNGLADTLGYYGVPPGPYLFLPLIGATTLRDAVARPLDLLILPTIAPRPFAKPAVSLSKAILSSLDEREENDAKLARLRAAGDPYAAQREEYLARRRAEIDVLKGKRKSLDDPPYYVLPEAVRP